MLSRHERIGLPQQLINLRTSTRGGEQRKSPARARCVSTVEVGQETLLRNAVLMARPNAETAKKVLRRLKTVIHSGVDSHGRGAVLLPRTRRRRSRHLRPTICRKGAIPWSSRSLPRIRARVELDPPWRRGI